MFNNKIFWWILLLTWMAASAYWHVCKIKELCDAPMTISAPTNEPAATPSLLVISDGSDLNLNTSGNFGFAKSGGTANLATVKVEIDSLARYMLANPQKRLTVTGSYASQEVNSTSFPDLGIARATDIKNYFTGKGLPDSLFILKSQLDDSITFPSDSLYGGINFAFNNFTLPATEIDLAKEQKYESIFRPMDLYFPTAGTDYIKTSENETFVLEAKKYLVENQDKKLKLTGHTDDDDSAEWNLVLSKKRALNVKNQFIAAGIPADRILTDGKGESQPKAPNNTTEGKKANRRVTIVVQ